MSALGEDILAWLDAAIARAESEAGYSEGEFIFFDVGDGQIADHYQHAGSPESVLRRCTADRQLLNLHCPAKGTNGFPDEWTEFGRADICPVVQLLAEGYGWNSETSHANTGARQTPPTEGDQVT
ncbi:hypothetical protein ACPCDX_28885 [Streptomyces koyangensis]|uniref:hypothetical protein n=1 Tax=Streptomyces koyangensis TaxID=188770 RepID=UPI003C2DCDBF